jgi:D-alanyl-D-alanine endopeptidase (penicillin-binding protein 7)
MIGKVIAQMLLSLTVIRIVPIDAANFEWTIGIPTPPSALAAPFFSLTSTPTLPRANDRILPPKKIDLSSYGVVTDAKSAIIVDDASGATLFAKHPDDVRSIGSITKLMTALVFLDTSPNLNAWEIITKDDYVGGGRVYLDFENPLRVRDIFAASVIGSDNTATQALSRLSGMSAETFVSAMNAKAKALGMTSSIFTEVTGIDADNVSTARDLFLLLREAKTSEILRDFMTSPQVMVTHASGLSVTIPSTDALFRSVLNAGEYRITGGKTGYIPEAGYCFMTMIERGSDEVFVAVLGGTSKDDRFADTKALALWAFDTFTWPQL